MKTAAMAILISAVVISGCMSVSITASGPGSVTVNLDKAVSTLPVNASGNTVPVSAMP
jgi:PBP1b-binding outer membrane lipoprotein LpoB